MRTVRDLHTQSSTESASPQFCKINNPCSSHSSGRRLRIQTRDERCKALAQSQLLAELPGRIFAGDLAHTDAVESAVRRVVLLDENRRIGWVEAVAQPLGIAAIPERPHLHGEKSRGGIHVAEDFHPDRRDPWPHQLDLPRRRQRKIDDAILHKRPPVGDADRRAFSIIQVGHTHHGIERQGAVRRGELIHVVDFAVRSAPPVERRAVPGSIPLFGVPGRSRRRHRSVVSRSRIGRRLGHVRRTLRGFFRSRRRARRLRRRPARNLPPPRASQTDHRQQEQSCRQEIEVNAEAGSLASASSPPTSLLCSARPLRGSLQRPAWIQDLGDFWAFCELRAALRCSSQLAASVSFSDTSRRNCVMRFSVSGAISSCTKAFNRVTSSSTRFPMSSKLWIRFSFATSSSMRLPNSSNRLIVASWRDIPRDFGIIGNALRASQGGECRSPINGNGASTNGRTHYAIFSAWVQAASLDQSSVPLAEPSLASTRRSVMSAARACAFRSLPSAKASPESSASTNPRLPQLF